ncbi:MAG: hypothetical protein HZR80_05185 [Candidatus Heimdallarchaeota archaeon]
MTQEKKKAQIKVYYKNNKKKSLSGEESKLGEAESISDSNESELNEEQLRVEDLESHERIKVRQKIKGVKRAIRTVERDPKEMITKYDRKTFDPGFMQMHTKEITYKLLREELKKTGLISDLVKEVNAGKEATIFIAHLQGAPLIIKSFRHQLTCHRQSKGNPQQIATSIASREYYRLIRAYKAGMRVPTPARQINNTIAMSFIGEGWEPAPQLRNVTLENPEVVLDEIIEQLRIMYRKAQLIHGDLSEYNILVHQGKPVIIDFPQAIDISLIVSRYTEVRKRNHQVLQKDIQTICNFFEKEYNLTFDFNEVYDYIAGKDAIFEKVDYSIEEIEEMIGLQRSNIEIRDKTIHLDSYQY